jgi:hypothetical protein
MDSRRNLTILTSRAEEQTALPPAEKLESAQAFRALVNKTADDWIQEVHVLRNEETKLTKQTIASVPVNRVELRAHLHERLPYYRWRVETYGAVLAGPYVYADPPLPVSVEVLYQNRVFVTGARRNQKGCIEICREAC